MSEEVVIARHQERIKEALKVQSEAWKLKKKETALDSLLEDVIQVMLDEDMEPRQRFNLVYKRALTARKKFVK